LNDKLRLLNTGEPISLNSGFHPALKNVAAVIFDVGGTIVHPEWRRLAQLVEAESGQPFSPEEIRTAFYQMLRIVDAEEVLGTDLAYRLKPHWGLLSAFRVLGIDRSVCNHLSRRLNLEHEKRHLWCEPDLDAADVLGRLKSSGLRLAVISNTEDGRIEESLTITHLAECFEFLIDSQLVGCRKPEAAIFHIALDRLGLKPHEAVYVGDSYAYDVLGSQRAGLRPIFIDRLGSYKGVDCTRISRLSELTNYSRTMFGVGQDL
jgi:HAD superfamily hydrolase (TIGR01509 family)